MVELVAKKFASVSSNSNISDEFLTRRATFEQQHSQPVAPIGESNETTADEDEDAINTPFEPHKLREPLRPCKKNISGGDDRMTYELLKEVPMKCHRTIIKFVDNIWQRGQLPPDWKKAIITLVLKTCIRDWILPSDNIDVSAGRTPVTNTLDIPWMM